MVTFNILGLNLELEVNSSGVISMIPSSSLEILLLYDIASSSTALIELIYGPLDVDSYEVRMLMILPDPPASLVRCTVEKTNPIIPMKYATLSYCWDDATITENVLVNSFQKSLTASLADACKRLCLPSISQI